MKRIDCYENIQKVIEENKIVVLYFSSNECSVCGVVKPKIEEITSYMPEVKSYEISIDEMSTAAGQLSIFTLPAVLVFIEGKEVIREARFISLDIFEEKLKRYYTMLY